jgi:peptidoglycan glycosyltransferase
MFGVAHSNNAILGKLAYQKLDPAALVDTAQQLGIAGALPGTDLVGTAGAITVPTTRDLDFAKTAAGFSSPGGGSQLSVAGGALLAATFADDGEQPIPRLIASIDGVAVPAPAKRRALSVEQARAVARMMVATCDSGSASKSFGKHRDLKVAGKTGTLATSKPFYMEHSWFVGFAPAASPQIIVSVLLGNAESWHLRGHEAARRMIDRALDPATQREKDRIGQASVKKRARW